MGRDKTRRSPSPPLPPSTPPVETEAELTEAAERRTTITKRRNSRLRCGEVAGNAAADCAAVCCCGPAVLLDILLTASVRVPAALCRMVRKARAKRKDRARKRSARSGEGVSEGAAAIAPEEAMETTPADEITEVEKEMWPLFHNVGFGRSPSQVDDDRH
ncbi:uncharacterized protein LOC141834455 [Curcuma longa]|uniref:uncharacterized protein LOC141834455 n=1 Tax=Curcuma longa TaxID=136217 RepID=UPI003D9F08BC